MRYVKCLVQSLVPDLMLDKLVSLFSLFSLFFFFKYHVAVPFFDAVEMVAGIMCKIN